jgi:D-3-phosphoglycerate dehydrogenase
MYNILIADKLPDSALKLFRTNRKYHINLITGLSESDLIKKIPAYHAIIVRSTTIITSSILDVAKNLKVIGRAGTGLDNIDTSSAKKHGIAVFNSPGSNSQAVAELTIGMIFCLARNLFKAYSSVKNQKWDKSEFLGCEIGGKTIGLIGFGQIGQKVGALASGLGMKILVYKRNPLQKSPGYEFELVSLDKLLERSDFVSFHIPKTEQTSNLVGLDKLKIMKKEAYLVNCARGGIVNEDDLLIALNHDLIAGAGLDVFESEPLIDFRLINHDKVIASPHIGGSTEESQKRVGEDIVISIMEFLETKYVFI